MKVYEVLNYFDVSRSFVCAKNVDEMLTLVDNEFLRKLEEECDDQPNENGERQYDSLRNDQKERLERITYTVIVENATKPSLHPHDPEADVFKFYR